MGKKYGVGGGKAAAQIMFPQPAKSSLLLPTLLPLKPLLLLLTSQMATLGLPGQGQTKTLGPGPMPVEGPGPMPVESPGRCRQWARA